MAVSKTYKVYVSSSYLDNKERRKIVQDAITTAGMVWHGMEIFTASGAPTVDECINLVRSADILVGIISWRYGWIPPGQDKSITELEYEAARERLMFFIDPDLPVSPDTDFDFGPDRWEKQNYLERFKERISRDQMPANFRESTLAAKVLHSLIQWRDNRERLLITKKKEKDVNKVFVVHGRNREAMYDVAYTIKRLGPDPILLFDEPNKGQTVVEKLESNSDAAFSVIIMTGDDEGRLAGDKKFSLRARQNVLVELGYFVGLLGRKYVCVLCEEDIEIPSDFHGVVYTPIDKMGAWRLELAREMKAAGLEVDINGLIST